MPTKEPVHSTAHNWQNSRKWGNNIGSVVQSTTSLSPSPSPSPPTWIILYTYYEKMKFNQRLTGKGTRLAEITPPLSVHAAWHCGLSVSISHYISSAFTTCLCTSHHCHGGHCTVTVALVSSVTTVISVTLWQFTHSYYWYHATPTTEILRGCIMRFIPFQHIINCQWETFEAHLVKYFK